MPAGRAGELNRWRASDDPNQNAGSRVHLRFSQQRDILLGDGHKRLFQAHLFGPHVDDYAAVIGDGSKYLGTKIGGGIQFKA